MSTNREGAAQSSSDQNQSNQLHVPVLLEQVLHFLNPQADNSYLDLTAGYGGHASKVLERTKAPGDAVLVDRDSNAIRQLEQMFAGQPVHIMHLDFLGASQALQAEGKRFDMILADLGVSSSHLNQHTRGFAIAADGPLDMRMDQRQELTAADIVNSYPVADIVDILRRYGEEPKAHSIAKKIAEYRKDRPITSTTQLAEIIARVWAGPKRHSRVHPATRSFQALRIAVNDELRLIEASIPIWIELLQPGGRLVVISFHSLEDRLVKQAFAEAGGDRFDAELQVLTKQPVTADEPEIVSNPRARSAKLRAAVKTKNR